MQRKKKKGQAAIEFITTYSWAIMGVLLAVGALSYFDLLNTDRFISERCDTGSQIRCVEALLLDDGEFYLNVSNNYPVNIEIIDMYTRKKGGEWISADPPISTNIDIPRGGTGLIQTTLIDLENNKKESLDITITFRREGTTFEYNTTGNVVLKVLPEDVYSP